MKEWAYASALFALGALGYALGVAHERFETWRRREESELVPVATACICRRHAVSPFCPRHGSRDR